MSDFRTKFSLPPRYESKGKTVWVEYAELAAKYKPIDLGHGFPDFPPPQYVKDALMEVASSSNNIVNQYTRGPGHPRLIFALSKLYSQLIGREINPYNEIAVSMGAYHALFMSIMGIIDKGDEVIIMEPFFECYGHMVKTAGGVPKYLPLKLRGNLDRVPTSDDWILDRTELESLFNAKTKIIIINTPHNPLGKVFSNEELTHIAELCKKWNVVCISDEVYEWLVYDSKKHVRMAALPGMWDRTVTVGSAGKVFGMTGWKLGWVYGPQYLISNIQHVLLCCIRAGNTFLQETAAICIEKELSRLGQEESYLISLGKELEVKRNFMFEFLTEAGLNPILSEGGYFIVADWSPLEQLIDLSGEEDEYKDYRFTKWMTKNAGIQGIPLTPFYSEDHKREGEKFVRYCFVKTDSYLNKAAKALKDWKLQLK